MKKLISILLSVIMIFACITCISLVTAFATDSDESDNTTITEGTINSTGIDLDPQVTVTRPQAITKEQLDTKLNELTAEISIGTVYSNYDEFLTACYDAESVVNAENPTQEQINTAYNNLVHTFENLEPIGVMVGSYYLGDYNNDGDVNIKDATDIQILIAKLNTEIFDFTRADVDRDMSINIKDATMVQCYCAGFLGESNVGFTGIEDSIIYFNELYNM